MSIIRASQYDTAQYEAYVDTATGEVTYATPTDNAVNMATITGASGQGGANVIQFSTSTNQATSKEMTILGLTPLQLLILGVGAVVLLEK